MSYCINEEEDKDIFFMEKACSIAEMNVISGKGGPFGAVIVSPLGEILGEGQNQVTLQLDPTQHAEMVAIRNACKNIQDFRLTNCTIYTSCEPCSMCLSACYWARIGKVIYGNTREEAKSIGFDDSWIYDEVGKPIMDRSLQMVKKPVVGYNKAFSLWKNEEKKKEY
jgi:tRNA(Arg) A34 adenosine deaminase TadA